MLDSDIETELDTDAVATSDAELVGAIDELVDLDKDVELLRDGVDDAEVDEKNVKDTDLLVDGELETEPELDALVEAVQLVDIDRDDDVVPDDAIDKLADNDGDLDLLRD